MRRRVLPLLVCVLTFGAVLAAQNEEAVAKLTALKAQIQGNRGRTQTTTITNTYVTQIDQTIALLQPAVPIPPDQWSGKYWTTGCTGTAPVFPTTNPTLTRADAAIDFDWTTGSPAPGVGTDHFCVQWDRAVTLPAGDQRFSVTADDGVRLWVDGVLVIDQWRDTAPTTYTATRTLTAGSHTIRMQFYENGGGAVARLSWAAAQPACTFTLSSTGASAPAGGGTGVVNVTANLATCAWTATSADAWATVTPASATGTAVATWNAGANTGAARVAVLTIAGQAFTVTQAAPSSTPPPTTGKAVLTPADFGPVEFYNVEVNGVVASAYSACLTSHRVNGDLRFLMHNWGYGLVEFSLAGKAPGSTVTATTNTWSGIPRGDHMGCWFDEVGQRLWTTSAIDYNPNYEQGQIRSWILNANGTTSDAKGPIGLQGVHAKSFYGGCQRNPTWFQSAYGVGPFACGWGGYSSLVSNGASMGLTFFALPDPFSYPNGTEIPTGSFKTLANHDGAEGADWYSGGGSAPTTNDRGRRLGTAGICPANGLPPTYGSPCNYHDDPARLGNLSTPPTAPPSSGAQWLSPIPRGPYAGQGRMTPGDTYHNTGVWIDGTDKTAFVAIASVGAGDVWYMSSNLWYDRWEFELHIFDPADLGAVAQGLKAPWSVQPVSVVKLNLPGMGDASNSSAAPISTIGGGTWDPVSKRYYVIGCGAETGIPNKACRLFSVPVTIN